MAENNEKLRRSTRIKLLSKPEEIETIKRTYSCIFLFFYNLFKILCTKKLYKSYNYVSIKDKC